MIHIIGFLFALIDLFRMFLLPSLELISTEIRYVDLLIVIRDVFMKAFPPRKEDSLSLCDNLFPHLDDVLECHNRLLYFMLEAHNATPDHITKNLGQCFITTVSSNVAFKSIIPLTITPGSGNQFNLCFYSSNIIKSQKTWHDMYMLIY